LLKAARFERGPESTVLTEMTRTAASYD
jgi:hypothetical protein